MSNPVSAVQELVRIMQAMRAFKATLTLPGSYQLLSDDNSASWPDSIGVGGYYIPINYDPNTNTITAA